MAEPTTASAEMPAAGAKGRGDKRKVNLAVYASGPCERCGGNGKLVDSALTGTRIRRLREHAGLTQEVVSAKMGITAAYLSDLELGKRAWSDGLLRRAESALGLG